MAITRDRKSYYDVIVELFEGKIDEEQLTDLQLNYLRAVRMAYSMILDARSKKYTVGSLIQMFDVHQATAYRIIKDAEKLFGEVAKVDKQISRQVAIEMAKRAFHIAQKRDDTRSMVSATKAYIQAAGLMMDDSEMPDLEKLQPSLVITVLPEGMESAISNMLQAGAVNLNQAPHIETIQYEEVAEGSETADTGEDRRAASER